MSIRKLFHILLLVIAVCYPGGPIIAHADEVLTIGVEDKDWAGHYQWQDRELKGLDADIMRAVAKNLGMRVVFEPYPWKRVLEMAERRLVDAVFDLAPTERRKAYLYYPDTPISLESTVFWVRRDSQFSFSGKLDKSLRLGLMAGADWSDRFAHHGKPDVVRFHSYDAAFRNLEAGRIDAFGAHLAPTREQAIRLGFLHKIKPSKPMLENLTYYVAFTHRAGNKDLTRRFSEELQKFFRSTEYDALLSKYGACDMENPLDHVQNGSQ